MRSAIWGSDVTCMLRITTNMMIRVGNWIVTRTRPFCMRRSIWCTIGVSCSRCRTRCIWVMILLVLLTNAIHCHIIARVWFARGAVDGAMARIGDRMDTTPAGNRGLRNLLSSGGIGVCVVAAVLRHREECYLNGLWAVFKVRMK